MGVSFRVAKVGKRYNHMVVSSEDKENECRNEPEKMDVVEDDFAQVADNIANSAKMKTSFHSNSESNSADFDVSFTLNLLPHGFFVGSVSEASNESLSRIVPGLLHPYDKTAETLFTAIEHGCLPGDLLDDLPCKFVRGAVLCEIRDYRNCYAHFGKVNRAAKKVPSVHRVLLQMCMENVIKDISSISNKSWTYQDILAAESRILKILQPRLRLNPNCTIDTVGGGTLAKKLDLKISWSWKKRKLNDAEETNLVYANSFQGAHIPAGGTTQDFKYVGSPVTEGEDAGSNQTKRNLAPNSLEKTCIQTSILVSNPLSSQLIYQSAPNCNARDQSNSITSAKQYDHRRRLAKRNSGICDMQPLQGGLKHPKKEPLDFPETQLPEPNRQHVLIPDLPSRSEVVEQLLNSKRLPDKGCNRSKQGLLSIEKEHTTLEDRTLSSAQFAGIVKQEVMEAGTASEHNSSLFGKSPREATKRKVQSSRFPTETVGARETLRGGDSLLREASQPTKKKSVSRSKELKTKTVEASSTSITNVVTANIQPVQGYSLQSLCGSNDDPLLKRLSKITTVAKRYRLNQIKGKGDCIKLSRPATFPSLQISAHLLYSDDFDQSVRERNLQSKLFLNSIATATTLTFSKPHLNILGNRTPVLSIPVQKKLVILKNPNAGMVEARIVHECEEEGDSNVFTLPSTFPSTCHAELYAAQFTKLMKREGYWVNSDLEPSLVTGGTSSYHQPLGSVIVPPPVRRADLSCSSVPVPSYHTLCSRSSGMSFSDHKQMLSNLSLPGCQGFPSSTIQLPAFSNSPIYIDAQLTSQRQHSQVVDNDSVSLFRMQQRQRNQQLLQRKWMMGGFHAVGDCVTANTVGGVTLSGNGGFSHSSGIRGIDGPPSFSAAAASQIDTHGHTNNSLVSNHLNFHGRNQFSGGISGQLLSSSASTEKSTLRNGLLFPQDSGKMSLLNIAGMTSITQQLPHRFGHHQLQMASQVSFNSHERPVPSPLNPSKFYQLPRMNFRQPNVSLQDTCSPYAQIRLQNSGVSSIVQGSIGNPQAHPTGHSSISIGNHQAHPSPCNTGRSRINKAVKVKKESS